jgi:hypothetical protein
VRSLAKLAGADQRYYLDQAETRTDHAGSVSSGAEDYYLSGPGRPVGGPARAPPRLPFGETSRKPNCARCSLGTIRGPAGCWRGRCNGSGARIRPHVLRSEERVGPVGIGDREIQRAVLKAQAMAVESALRCSPSPAIRRFVEALLARHPDLTELDDAEVDDSPWADGPLIGNASGSFIYFALVHSRAKEVLPFIVETAAPERLVVYDPQTERLLTDGPERKRRSWWRRS